MDDRRPEGRSPSASDISNWQDWAVSPDWIRHARVVTGGKLSLDADQRKIARLRARVHASKEESADAEDMDNGRCLN